MIEDWELEKERETLAMISGIRYADVPAWYQVTRRDLKMDLILPKRRENHKPLPAVLWICGGAYMVVDRSVWMPELVAIARAGFVVASAEYRTSNEAQFPAALTDCKAAVRFLRANASELCIDPNHIYAMGESAGATMACLLGVTGDDRDYEKGEYLEESSNVGGVVDFYGITAMKRPSTLSLTNRVPSWTIDAFLGENYSDETARLASAVSHVTKNTPPFLILHGTEDAVVPIGQSQELYDELLRHGVRAEFIRVKDAMHGDDLFYQERVTTRVITFLKSLTSACGR